MFVVLGTTPLWGLVLGSRATLVCQDVLYVRVGLSVRLVIRQITGVLWVQHVSVTWDSTKPALSVPATATSAPTPTKAAANAPLLPACSAIPPGFSTPPTTIVYAPTPTTKKVQAHPSTVSSVLMPSQVVLTALLRRHVRIAMRRSIGLLAVVIMVLEGTVYVGQGIINGGRFVWCVRCPGVRSVWAWGYVWFVMRQTSGC